MDDFWDVLLWSFWIFFWVAAIMLWIRCLIDMFSDSTLGGWAKAGWSVLLVLLPWLGALIYLIARGNSIGERQYAAAVAAREREVEYIQSVASRPQSAVEQVASAKALLDAGALTQEEFERLKETALA
jgi:hypothetical protein